MYTESWDVSLEEGSMFLNNVAETGDGGGLYSSSSTKLVLSAVSFEDNTAVDMEGSHVFGRGGAIAFSLPIEFRLENVVIRKNKAVYGGGVYSPLDSVVTIRNSILDSNIASMSGGGLYTNTSSSFKAYDSIVRNNSALTEDGGGAYLMTWLNYSSNASATALFSNLSFVKWFSTYK